MKVLIIGGVAAGASAAARLRRLSEDAEIIIVERSGYISYANCGLPYYVGGVIENKAALTLQTPESFWSRFRIEARVNTEAISIDRQEKTRQSRDREAEGSVQRTSRLYRFEGSNKKGSLRRTLKTSYRTRKRRNRVKQAKP